MSGTSAFQFFYTPTVAGAGFGQYNYFKESVFGGFERYNTETTKLLFDNGYVSAAYYANVSNTTSVKLLIYGYEEPQELY